MGVKRELRVLKAMQKKSKELQWRLDMIGTQLAIDAMFPPGGEGSKEEYLTAQDVMEVLDKEDSNHA